MEVDKSSMDSVWNNVADGSVIKYIQSWHVTMFTMETNSIWCQRIQHCLSSRKYKENIQLFQLYNLEI